MCHASLSEEHDIAVLGGVHTVVAEGKGLESFYHWEFPMRRSVFLYLRKCSLVGVFHSTQSGRQKLSRARGFIWLSKLGCCPSQPRQKASPD